MSMPSTAHVSAAIAAAGLLAGFTALPAAADSPVTTRQSTQLRTSAKATSTSVAKLVRGQTITAVSSSSGWTKVRFAKSSAFIPTRQVAKGVAFTPPGRMTGTGSRVITANLNLRRGPGYAHGKIRVVTDGTRVRATGKSSGGFSEVVSGPSRGWMSNRYLVRSTRGLPEAAGVRVATTNLNVRVGSGATSRVVGVISKGAQVSITGVTSDGRSEILYRGSARWVATRLLALKTTSAGPTVPANPIEKALTPWTIAVHRAARSTWPEIKTIYGYRNSPGSDHSQGRALDLMVPGYKTAAGKKLGGQVAEWAVANMQAMHIDYVIWNQHILSAQRADEGWRLMADRGGDSANHFDHVHISVSAE